MFKNYLKITLALLQKHKLYSFINIAGLAVGLAACILIGLFVRHEFSYDNWHPDGDRIYRITRDYFPDAGRPELLLVPNAPQAAPLLARDFPEIDSATRLRRLTMQVTKGDVSYYESSILFADANVFDFFAFDWLQGSPETALDEPGTVVLTRSLAQRYFGREDPMGQVLEMSYGISLQVTGVIRDLPDNTHISATGIGSLQSLVNRFGMGIVEGWGNNNYHTYVKLVPGASPDSVAAGFPAFMDNRTETPSDFSGMRIQPLAEIHLHSAQLQFPMKPAGNLNTVVTLIAVAACILMIACFNFMNLSTARSSQRGREVGMRKAVGAGRGEIIGQFLGESILSALVALVLAVVLVELVLPVFNAFLALNLSLELFANPALLLLSVAIACITGLAAGAYPAFYLSAFRSSQVLRGDTNRGRAGLVFRNALVVLQFSAAIALVVATAVVYLQLNFARTMDTGFNRDQVLILDNVDARWETLQTALANHPGVAGMTASNIPPGRNNGNGLLIRYEGLEGQRSMQYLMVDTDFFGTYEINMLAGRDFSDTITTDRYLSPTEENPQTTAAFILSDMTVRQFGWTPDEAIGKWFEVAAASGFSQSVRGFVIGVVDDINFESVATPIEPVFYILPDDNLYGSAQLTSASIRLSGNNVQDTLAYIDDTWDAIFPDRPIVRSFLDQDFQALYEEEQRLGQLFTCFASLAITIACLGLFGLASFNAERRTKEIGVRKVMGSSVWRIVTLLTYDFSRLVLISNIIAWPVAWFAMNRWLEGFAYRIDLTPMVFIGSGLIALCIAWVTVGGTAARAASTKPVLALRYE